MMKKLVIGLLVIVSTLSYGNSFKRDALFSFDASQSLDINECTDYSNICKPFKLQDENGNFSTTIYRKVFVCIAYGEEVHMALPSERMKIFTTKDECLNF